MSGIYVAKPAVVSVPDVPPGWNPDWPNPGPYPPGYTPTLTMVMTADDNLAFDGTASVTGSARDNVTYPTNEPSDMTWKAAISGSPVNLRFNGDSEYSASLSSSVSFGTYWGATPSIEFELTAENVDDVVTLTGSYILDGQRIESAEEITIGATTVIIEFLSDTPTNAQWGAAMEMIGQESGPDAIGRVGLEWVESDIETEGEISVAKTSTTMTIQVDLLRGEVYNVAVGYSNITPGTINMTWTATVNFIGEDPTEAAKAVAVAQLDSFNVFPSLDTVWITIDGTDGTITVVNP